MERDDIIKALECCTEQDYCVLCPCDNECIGMESLMLDALSLIKELTEENGNLRASTIDYRNIPNIVAEARADTVKEMKNRIAQKIGTYTKESYVYVHAWFKLIDKIAKEMLEGTADG